jgi:hypothetical protein
VRGFGDGRVWVEVTGDKVSLQVNEPDLVYGGVRAAEAVLTSDEVVDLAAQLLASVRPVGRFTPVVGEVPS